jgi:hypothetical protein
VANDSLTVPDIAGSSSNFNITLSGIPNGRCSTVIFGISAAKVGEVPIVTIGAAIQQGIVLYGMRVASAGHVEVAACNFSGGAMDPISDFPGPRDHDRLIASRLTRGKHQGFPGFAGCGRCPRLARTNRR